MRQSVASSWITFLHEDQDVQLEREIRDRGWNIVVYTLAEVEPFGIRIIGYQAEAERDGLTITRFAQTPTKALQQVLYHINKLGEEYVR